MQIRFDTSVLLSIPVLFALVICLVPVSSFAFVPEDLERLKKSKKCPGCDPSGADLRNARLHGTSMDHATIDDVDFKGADLQDVTCIDGRVCKKGSIGVCK